MSSKLTFQMSVLSPESRLKSRLGRYYFAKLESKIARSYVDDKDSYNLTESMLTKQFRPGQRDDEISCLSGVRLMYF